jgi:diguanylate cyclase (GGDEF)-like protein/PAS domain S-box-containing protein
VLSISGVFFMDKEKLYFTIINNLPDGVYFVNTERRITFWNKAAEDITGYKAEEIVGQCCQNNLLNHIDSDGRALCLLGCPLFATILDGRHRKDTVFLQHKEGHRIPVSIKIIPIVEDGAVAGAIEIFTQSSATFYDSKIIDKLMDMDLSDDLSASVNRSKTESYISYRLNELGRYQQKFCIIYFGIDNYQEFINANGGEEGDRILKAIHKSVSINIRPTDYFCHWKGDVFAGVFEIGKNYEATLLAEKLRILVAGSDVSHERGALSVTASFGVTVAREDDTFEKIIKRAENLMRQSKEKAKNCISSDA